MLVFTRANFTLFAVPKTGSTAYHLALRNHAQIVLSQDTSLKHMPLRKYETHFAPWLKEAHGYDPERVAVMRNPIDQIRSWYKYRMRPKLKGGPRDLTGMTFEQFVGDVISPNPPEHARIGDQRSFLSNGGQLGIDHLFAYERPDLFMTFLEERLGQRIEPKRRNVSPDVPAPLSQEMEEALIAARPDEWALYEAMMIAGGHLHTPVTSTA